jgi:hypothetical protein
MSEPVEARRAGNLEPSQSPTLSGTNTTASRETAYTEAFGSSEEQKLLSRVDTFLKIADLSGARLILERATRSSANALKQHEGAPAEFSAIAGPQAVVSPAQSRPHARARTKLELYPSPLEPLACSNGQAALDRTFPPT